VYTIAGYKIWTLGGSGLVHQQGSYNGFPRMVHWWVQCKKIPSNISTSQLQETLDVALDEYKIFIKLCS
jgi:hypothetical protein